MAAERPTPAAGPKIFYLVGDYDVPSWGVGLIYGHVRLLRSAGYDACVLHERHPFRITWMDNLDVPVRYLEPDGFGPAAGDFLVVPEVSVAASLRLEFDCRRIVFVQGSYFLLQGHLEAPDFRSLGFESAIAALPHIAGIVNEYFGLEATVVPPFIAPYFFVSEAEIEAQERSRVVLLSAKPQYGQAGYLDFEIVTKLLRKFLPGGWRVEELTGLTHEAVATTMKSAAFLVNINTLEGFNATVPEAMAAGCIPVCYEAFGGRDFLADNQNAFVFPNNHVYPLVGKILAEIQGFANNRPERQRIQRNALATANTYTEAATRHALERFFSGLIPVVKHPAGAAPER